MQKSLNKWARKNRVIEDDELLIVTVRTHAEIGVLSMSPEDFFSKPRLKELEDNPGTAIRAHNGVLNSNRHYTETGYTNIHKDMASWLSQFNDVWKLDEVKNLGKGSIALMVKLLKKEGLTIG